MTPGRDPRLDPCVVLESEEETTTTNVRSPFWVMATTVLLNKGLEGRRGPVTGAG